MSPLAPKLVRRIGPEATLLGVVALLGGGIALRLATPLLALFAGTLLAGAAIAVGNVVLPGLIKRDFPARRGLMSSLYSMSVTAGGALAAGVTVPIGRALGLGWRATLALWAGFALVALVVLVPLVARPRERLRLTGSGARLRSDRLAWLVTAFMGTQSVTYYSLLAWLPSLFEDHGLSASTSGLLLSVAGIVSIPAALLTPMLAQRRPDQRLLVAVGVGLSVLGVLGLLVAPVSGDFASVVVLGLGQGSTFSLALTLIVLRAPDASVAAELSGMVQSGGYLLAATGPLLTGALRQLSGGWSVPLAVMLGLLGLELVSGLGAGRDQLVGGGASPARLRV